MKILFSIFVLFSLLYSNNGDIGVMEEAVSDIAKLKNDYKTCQEDLKNRFVKTDYKELDKYKILLKKEKEKNQKMLKDMEWFTKTIETLENKLNQNNKKLLKIKQYQQKVLAKEVVKKHIEKARFMKASNFRLKLDASIFDKPNGKKVDNWMQNTTFTSNIRTDNWIKITGYFVNKKWRKATKEMWIEADKVFKRK